MLVKHCQSPLLSAQPVFSEMRDLRPALLDREDLHHVLLERAKQHGFPASSQSDAVRGPGFQYAWHSFARSAELPALSCFASEPPAHYWLPTVLLLLPPCCITLR